MLLLIDIGNTMTDLGVYDETQPTRYYSILSRRDISSAEASTALSLFFSSKGIECSSIEGVVISSVVPTLSEIYREVCADLFGIEPMFIGPKTKTGIRVVTDNPKEVGSDMIAACAGAKAHDLCPCIIVDFGTATKVILCEKDGSFMGCTIGAGLRLQESSLSSNAALLPEVSMQIPDKMLGKNTADSMNSALTYGNAFAVTGLADGLEIEARHQCKRVLTGGFASVMKTLLPEFDYYPHLVLDGIYAIYRRNQK